MSSDPSSIPVLVEKRARFTFARVMLRVFLSCKHGAGTGVCRGPGFPRPASDRCEGDRCSGSAGPRGQEPGGGNPRSRSRSSIGRQPDPVGLALVLTTPAAAPMSWGGLLASQGWS